MMPPVTVLLGLLVLLLAGACVALYLRVRALEADLAAGQPLALGEDDADAGRVITVEISDPLAVAAAESRAAGLLGRVSPGLVRRKVYELAAGRIHDGLVEESVEATVRVRTTR